jgi:ubiquinone/menaquinone biosynthesis C-methylase UbiE
MTIGSEQTNEERLRNELENFSNNIDVHELPGIFHYWSNRYLRPMLEEHGISHPDDLFVEHMFNSVSSCEVKNPVFISIGSGNCDTEVRIAKRLREKGLRGFCIECLDLNPNMLMRGREEAVKEEVIENMSFIELDLNKWKADKEYTCVIANQSLHHIQNLEGVISEIKRSLHTSGTFITSDMAGRNGHQRWPEALKAVHAFWQELPQKYTFNHQLKRYEPLYENWDCSNEGFEGIRAQDILPLLIENFHFQLFIGFSNVIDVFIDRGFGHNFAAENKRDTDFIDRVHRFDEESILNGSIKPTHIMAVMQKHPVTNPVYSRGLSPEFCVRNPDAQIT